MNVGALLLFTSCVFLFVCADGDPHAPIVQTTLGSLRGSYVSVKGKESGAHAFLGVPFAKPPVGPVLRLSPPQPVEGWHEERNATQQPPMCVQHKPDLEDLYSKLAVELTLPDVSEDCLYLNIYSPANRAPDEKLPVMVWIHGGGFVMGAASNYDGSAMAAYEDVVVVLIQYRLGLLGFFSTGEADMAGNFGLLDQVEALKWVQQHIHNFGGNPDLVTIYGESAGGMSVSFLLLSPLASGLFHHAVAQSGTAETNAVMYSDPLLSAKIAANRSGCSIDSLAGIADCMKHVDLPKIAEFSEKKDVPFPIRVDGRFLTKPVDELFRNHEFAKVPFMTGIVSDEGGWLLGGALAPKNWTEGMSREEAKTILSYFYPPDPKDIELYLIIDEYSGKSEDPLVLRRAYTDILGDVVFTIPTLKTVNYHSEAGASVFLYEYTFIPEMLKRTRADFVGADHSDELYSVFAFCLTTTHVKIQECSTEEEDFTKKVMKYWANFARTGSPNGEGLVHWPQYGPEENYLVLDKEPVVRQQLRKERFVFLTQTLPEMVQEFEKKDHKEL